LGHTTSAVPGSVPGPDYHHQVLGGNKAEVVAYRLACQLGGTDDDNLIIHNLPLFLSDAARAWLEHLPPTQISNWDDLVKAFTGNFQGTYVRPGNSWDLRSCRQQPGNPCESTSDGFQSSAPSCPTSPTQTSSARSSPAPRAKTW
jgi:hypothetical protein